MVIYSLCSAAAAAHRHAIETEKKKKKKKQKMRMHLLMSYLHMNRREKDQFPTACDNILGKSLSWRLFILVSFICCGSTVTDSPSSIVDMDDGSKSVQSSTVSFFKKFLWYIILPQSWAGHRCVRDHYTRTTWKLNLERFYMHKTKEVPVALHQCQSQTGTSSFSLSRSITITFTKQQQQQVLKDINVCLQSYKGSQ